MIRVNVFIKVEERYYPSVLEAAKELTTKSLNDAGCIAYDIFASATRKDVLMICETWSDEKALDAHSKTPHFVELVAKMEAHAAMKIEKFEF